MGDKAVSTPEPVLLAKHGDKEVWLHPPKVAVPAPTPEPTESQRIAVLEGRVKTLSLIVGDMGVGMGRMQTELMAKTRVLKELAKEIGRMRAAPERSRSLRLVSHIRPGMRGR